MSRYLWIVGIILLLRLLKTVQSYGDHYPVPFLVPYGHKHTSNVVHVPVFHERIIIVNKPERHHDHVHNREHNHDLDQKQTMNQKQDQHHHQHRFVQDPSDHRPSSSVHQQSRKNEPSTFPSLPSGNSQVIIKEPIWLEDLYDAPFFWF
ncbi:hypothetical protein CDAR_445321 [Caerostris darwini]|uniref:Uncharacterized protein n=1 Tax=Caerostris darwini TaxID=1538125 RepID=A0AAV4SB68_9ARAC|nr:hypothetical protein CDAR_445321 [Caerostris darwini]